MADLTWRIHTSYYYYYIPLVPDRVGRPTEFAVWRARKKGLSGIYISLSFSIPTPSRVQCVLFHVSVFLIAYIPYSPLLNLVVYQTDHRYKKKKSVCKCINKVSAKEQNDRKKAIHSNRHEQRNHHI